MNKTSKLIHFFVLFLLSHFIGDPILRSSSAQTYLKKRNDFYPKNGATTKKKHRRESPPVANGESGVLAGEDGTEEL